MSLGLLKNPANSPDEIPMNDQIVTEITHRAMATEFGVFLCGEGGQATEAAVDALDQLDQLESLLSIYRPQSEISRINLNAGIAPIKINQQVFDVLRWSLQIHALTSGAFDVTAGPLVECWGFTRRRGRKPTDEEIATAKAKVGAHLLRLDENHQTAFLEEPGMQINLGGIGKGYAVDQIAKRLDESGVMRYLIHGGKSTLFARCPPEIPLEEHWTVGIEHPLRPGIRMAEVKLGNGAMATSGSGKQFFHYQGKRIGHVIDPRTGRPAGEMLSLTLTAPTATAADAFSTAYFIEGADRLAEAIRDSQKRRAQGDQVMGPTSAIMIRETRFQGGISLERMGDVKTA